MTIAIMTGNLKLEHRIIIQTMKYYGHKISEIADYIGCAVSTIYRELKKLGSFYFPVGMEVRLHKG